MEVMGIWHVATVRWPVRGEERGQVRELGSLIRTFWARSLKTYLKFPLIENLK
jgi:hypothetical protein